MINAFRTILGNRLASEMSGSVYVPEDFYPQTIPVTLSGVYYSFLPDSLSSDERAVRLHILESTVYAAGMQGLIENLHKSYDIAAVKYPPTPFAPTVLFDKLSLTPDVLIDLFSSSTAVKWKLLDAFQKNYEVNVKTAAVILGLFAALYDSFNAYRYVHGS